MRIHTMLHGLADAPANARTLEGLGVDGVFTFEGPHDPFVPLVLAASATERVELMTNVAIAFPRNPIQLAHLAWDLHALSGGRFALGLGTQVRTQVEQRYGVPFDRPVARLRELVGALRAVFSCWQDGTPLDVRGEFYTHTRMTPMFDPGPLPHGPPPILLGALGPQLTRLAAEVADGLLVMPFNSARFFAGHTLPAVEAGLARAGRSVDDLRIVGEVIVCAGRDEVEQQAADAAGRWLLSFYASTPAYRPVLEAEGWGDLQPELQQLTREGRWDELPARIDDTMLATLAVRGTPAECARAVQDRFAGRVDDVGFYLPYEVPTDLLGELVDAFR